MFDTEKIKEFRDKCYPFFYYDEPSVEKDEEIRRYYRRALEDVEGYLTALLWKELEEDGCTGAGVSLLLPLGGMHIHVGGGMDSVMEDMPPVEERKEPDIMYTPIGRLDFFTYRAVIRDKDNPVKMLYGCLGDFLWVVHGKLALMPDGLRGILNGGRLRKDEGFVINDPLNLHRYDSLWQGLDEFFRGVSIW